MKTITDEVGGVTTNHGTHETLHVSVEPRPGMSKGAHNRKIEENIVVTK